MRDCTHAPSYGVGTVSLCFNQHTMKLSEYNFVVPTKEEKIIVFNTLSGAIIRIPESAYTIDNEALVANKFVVPKSLNEIDLYKFRYMAGIYDTQSWHITIAPTMLCNFNCPYCFEGDNKKQGLMTHNVIEQLKKFIKLKSEKGIHITWFGGEPFLGWDAISEISEFLLVEDIKFSANAITNGSICNESILRDIDRYHIRSIQITIDGLKETHDSKRVFKTGKPSFDHIISNIHKFLQDSKVNVIIRINLDKNNLPEYPELQAFLLSEFKDFFDKKRVSLSPNPIKDRTKFDGCSNCLSNEEYHNFEKITLSEKRLPQFSGPCPLRCRSSIGIGPDGNIYKCLEHFGDRTKSIGSLIDGTVNLNRQAEYAIGVLPFDVKECSSCKLLPVCGGGCAIDLLKCKSGHDKPICSISKEIVKDQILRYCNAR